MKRKILLYSLLTIAAFFVVRAAYYMIGNATYKPQNGDIIFHISDSYQSTAIKLGTLSRYSHCGVVVMENGILLSQPNPLGDYHFLNIPLVKKHITNRGMSLDQEVVPPSDLVKSRRLRTVSYGYGRPFWL